MGMLAFRIPPPYVLPSHIVDRAQLVSVDAVPWVTRNRCQEATLVLTRDSSESARLCIPWQVPGFGEYMLQTGTLVERPEPYLLPVELARGSVARLREYTAELHEQGVDLPDHLALSIHQATRLFIQAATGGTDLLATGRNCDRCLQICLECMDAVERHLQSTSRVLEERRKGNRLTLLSLRLEHLPDPPELDKPLASAFNSVWVAADWQRIEPQPQQYDWESAASILAWAQSRELQTGCGPLILLRRHVLPDWIYLWEDDFDALENHVAQEAEAVARHFSPRCQRWHVAASVNRSQGLRLTDQQRLQLAAAAVDAVQRAAPSAERIVSFDQPWAEYLARGHHEATPLDYADAIVRANVGVTGLGLEINLGYWPEGSARRNALDVDHLLALWSRLELPLFIWLAIPSESTRDPQARVSAQPISLRANQPSRQAQADLAEQWVLQFLAHPAVAGVCWTQLRDDHPHDFAHAGLVDPHGALKPVVQSWKTLRQWYGNGSGPRENPTES